MTFEEDIKNAVEVLKRRNGWEFEALLKKN